LLTADLVRARRRGDELKLQPLDKDGRAEALELSKALLALAEAHVGKTRAELEEVVDAVVGEAKDRKLAEGLAKLVWDRCELAEAVPIDPEELRHDVFTVSQAMWARTGEGEPFQRAAVMQAIADARGLAVDDVERGLYADLREAHVVTEVARISPVRLVEAYELAQGQAVLLRAVRVAVDIKAAHPGAYRTLFKKLKFLRLLYTITPRAKGGYRLELDGPFSMFESSTRYGLALALALPAIRELDHWSLDAEIRWGTERRALRCKLEGTGMGERDEAPHVSDEVQAVIDAIADSGSPWRAQASTALLDLPGHGVCVPDLTLTHAQSGAEVHVEVMGYWSRDAVWRRVELVEAGLDYHVIFAVGQHLRVSEAALDGAEPGALYVYKRTMSAKALLDRADAVAAKPLKKPAKPRGKKIVIDDDEEATPLHDDTPPKKRKPKPRPAEE
jgi:predicted nuclease of restriction endonuclease-like RecB superfamily